MRKSGILLPISSLPSKYGIGAFSKEAYDFVDLLKETGQSLWQILPLGPTGFGDSPYQSFSTFAGNPYFIDLDELVKEGILTEDECSSYDWGDSKEFIDYSKIYNSKSKILRLAYNRSNIGENEEFREFCTENYWWLNDYALYMSIKDSKNGAPWIEWPKSLRLREEEALSKIEEELKDDVEFYKYQQYLFTVQWNKLKSYANENGIKIIGDIPIYVSLDGSDTWSNPKLFQVDEDGLPTDVAGCPPDSFSETGQLWGNPLYNWEYNKETNYEWWIKRISHSFKLHDIVRIDHFRGFDEYYAIPYSDDTAKNGQWRQGPGIDLFDCIKKELGELDIIAEDLGFLTDSVIKLLEDTGYPGMKILQFAFDSREESDYLPHNYTKNSIVYTGTHDNDTIMGWYKEIDELDRDMAHNYLNNYKNKDEIQWDFIALAMRSVSNTCIIPVQDYLGLGSDTRINTPATSGNNWKWRMKDNSFTKDIMDRMYTLTKVTGRL